MGGEEEGRGMGLASLVHGIAVRRDRENLMNASFTGSHSKHVAVVGPTLDLYPTIPILFIYLKYIRDFKNS